MKKNIVTYYSHENRPKKFPEYAVEDVNAEKAIKLYNFLKEFGWDVQLELLWGCSPSGHYLNLMVCDYSHHDSEGNEYCYSFDPLTGEAIPE